MVEQIVYNIMMIVLLSCWVGTSYFLAKCDECFNDMQITDAISALLSNGYELVLTPIKYKNGYPYDKRYRYTVMVEIKDIDETFKGDNDDE